MKVSVEFSTPLFPLLCLSRREARDIARRILEALGCTDCAITLVITNDFRMQHLNITFLSCPGPTNVLAFEEDSPGEEKFLGEVFINAQAVKRESALYGQPLFEHFIRILAHGIQHLAGFEHGQDMEDWTLHLQHTISAEEYGLEA